MSKEIEEPFSFAKRDLMGIPDGYILSSNSNSRPQFIPCVELENDKLGIALCNPKLCDYQDDECSEGDL